MTQVSPQQRDEALPSGVYGAADPNFACAVRGFSAMFPHHRFGGGALAVYLDGEPVVDVWTGWADRRGRQPWTADTGAMVFSATKGIASTVIHRLADRGLIDYDAPVAEYWTAFGANGKADITVREMMRHRAGLSRLNGVSKAEMMDHIGMEERIAAAPASRLRGKPAYHALTYGWLLSGLARSVTGKGMRTLFREEIAEPLNAEGIHLGRPPADSRTKAAQIIHPQLNLPNPLFNLIAPYAAQSQFSGGFGALYFPGMKSTVQGDTPMLDSEIPAANAVATARGLARMYGALANGGQLGGRQFLSSELTTGLVGRPSLALDHTVVMPMSFHLGYHSMPIPGLLPGFGHVGLGGSLGWADPESGLSFGFVHNRLLTPFVVADQAGFVATAAMVRRGAALARTNGYRSVADLGARFDEAAPVAG
ncbi:serine hydrolase domain-containing protein [Mycobacterium sp. OTB74]|uniref:esterase/beta-lactamase LipL n=1 Tax=Mycobacterium sp. OTB74 TaxID=1853452 RepID=UPI002476B255|nr:serine hydrolase domain-containing protein [Mycobacterium sp. OTB74]MDH6244163.1 CubicO group peptidase (beta-lactamase class C family) [Mycobacterium sp. OTB74]